MNRAAFLVVILIVLMARPMRSEEKAKNRFHFRFTQSRADAS